jgi:glycogen debranching enzyme
MFEKKIINQAGVQTGRGLVKFGDWANKMHDNFERCFWIPQRPNEDNKHDVDARMINRRGIYKDVYGSSEKYTDY